MKKWFFSAGLVILVLSANLTLTYAENISPKKEYFRAGFGFGIPYGVLGGNFEVFPIDYLSLTVGLGIAPGGSGWAVGGRVYPFGKSKNFRPRLSVFHGIVAFLETKYEWEESDYENITGNALGVGFGWKFTQWSLDFDLIFPDFEVPKGYEEKGSDVKISIGCGYHF